MAARRGVAFFVRADRGYVVVSGADRLSFLHALLTNDIARLGAGAGCYAALLTPNGRMVTDVWVHELGDATLLRLGAESAPTLLARLDALVFSEDVQLGDVTTAFRGVSIVGPGAHALMGTMLGRPVDLELHGAQRVGSDSGVAIIVRSDDLGVEGYELLVEAGRVAGVRLLDGQEVWCRTVVVCVGTFLNGVIHIGRSSSPAGRLVSLIGWMTYGVGCIIFLRYRGIAVR